MEPANKSGRKFNQILSNVARYYTGKLEEYGVSAKGVDWNSTESQNLRFDQLIKILETGEPFSILDYGCGFGSLFEYLNQRGVRCEYHGFDVSEAMLHTAREIYHDRPGAEFFSDEKRLKAVHYVMASGIFNVKQTTPDEEWKQYMEYTVNRMADLSLKGFSFNALTLYSDIEKRRPDLYYADPLYWFDYCKRKFSRFVSLLHDYPLYEFTILVKK